MGQQRLRTTEVQPEVLAATPHTEDLPAGQPGGEIQLSGEVAPHRAGMAHLDGSHSAPGDVFGQAQPDDLDLGQLRHTALPHRWGVPARQLGQ